jgi:hypothetical protein
MGQLCNKCSKKNQEPFLGKYKREEEKEIELQFKSYSSSSDFIFKKIEDKYMVFKYFQLFEISQLITNIKTSQLPTESSSEKGVIKTYSNNVENTDFDIFIENRILKNNIIKSLVSGSDNVSEVFKEFIECLFRQLVKSRKDYFLHKNGAGKRIKKGSLDFLKKLHLYPIAILYSSSSNIGKVEWLFNLLSVNNKTFARNDDLDEFLFYLFLIPSLAGLNAINKAAEKFSDKLNALNDDEYHKYTDAFEVKDVIRLKSIFLDEFFKTNNELTKNEYKLKFEFDNFGWIFNPNGIRSMLEKHNDVQTDL